MVKATKFALSVIYDGINEVNEIEARKEQEKQDNREKKKEKKTSTPTRWGAQSTSSFRMLSAHIIRKSCATLYPCDPESPLRWTSESFWRLSKELSEDVFMVAHMSVARLLLRLVSPYSQIENCMRAATCLIGMRNFS